MKNLVLAAAAAAALAAAAAVKPNGRAVEFTAKATGIGQSETIEFVVCGPGTDHDYEALFVADDSAGAIAAAFAKSGIPQGLAPNPFKARLWPQGEFVSLSCRRDSEKNFRPITDFVVDAGHEAREEGCEEPLLAKPFRWTGGALTPSGALRASTESPNAIFALYTHGPSPVLLDSLLDQAVAYGRFRPAVKFNPGDKVVLRLEWDGHRRTSSETIPVGPSTDLAAELAKLKTKAEASPGNVFASMTAEPGLTIRQAAAAAQVFARIDGLGVKMNGAAPGEFFYGAFIPEERWRQRPGRLFQPFEVRISRNEAGKLEKRFVYIEEDWSGEGLDPILKPRETPFNDWSELAGLVDGCGQAASKLTVMLVFAPADLEVQAIKPVLSSVPPRIATFYVFGD